MFPISIGDQDHGQ